MNILPFLPPPPPPPPLPSAPPGYCVLRSALRAGQVHWTDLRLVRGFPRCADAVIGPRGMCAATRPSVSTNRVALFFCLVDVRTTTNYWYYLWHVRDLLLLYFGLLKLTRDVGAVRRRRRPCGGFVKRLMVCLRGHMPPRLYGHEHVRTR